MEDLLTRGASEAELSSEINRLEKQFKSIAYKRPSPPQSLSYISGSKLIGSGWEWAAYSLPNEDEIIKVPSGAFKEVNTENYLEKTISSYNLCKEYLDKFILDSTFERIYTDKGLINTIRQSRLMGKEADLIDTETLSSKTKREFAELAFGVIRLIKQEGWAPDLYLREKIIDGKRFWKLNNVIIEGDKPTLFDFSSYFDQWRLYPDFTARNIVSETKLYTRFLEDLEIRLNKKT